MSKKRRSSASTRQSATQFSTAKRILSVFFVILLVLDVFAVGLIGYTIYYYRHNPPTTTAVGKVDTLVYDVEQKYAIELNLYTNDKQNGIEVKEFRVNYYIDTLIPTSETGKSEMTANNTDSVGNVSNSGIIADCFKDTYTQGVQFIGKSIFEQEQSFDLLGWRYNIMLAPVNANFYNTSNGTSYKAINELDYLDKWIIDFGENNLGRITQDKGYEFISEGYLWLKYYLHKDINVLIRDIFRSAESLEYGKKVLVFDLSDYLTFEYFSTDDYKFHVPSTTDQHLYINVLVNKSENGMINAEQSMFGLVNNNSDWSYDGVVAEDYWTSHTGINLTEADFDVNSTTKEMTLKSSAIKYYSQFDANTLDLTINIDLSKTTGTGLSKNAFGDLKVDRIIVSSDSASTFTYYANLADSIIADSNVTLEVVE